MNLIAAVDEHWALGKDGDQLVYLSQDLKRFKALTTGHPVILGRKTMATFPGGRPLKGRRNLILSRNPDFAPEGAEVFPDLDSLLAQAPEDACVIDITMANAMTGEGTNYADLTYGLSLTSEEYGIGFRKDSDLTEKVNGIINELNNDGTLPALAEKYELTLALDAE